jgi:hypothetical protein
VQKICSYVLGWEPWIELILKHLNLYFSDTHANSRTQFLSEVERLGKSTSIINSVLNSGYAKGGKAPGVDNRGKLKQYHTYSPKMFA